MSIANEVSSEIAAAMLSREGDENSEHRSNLKDVIIKAHSALQHLTIESRKATRRAKREAPPTKGNAASGSN